MTELDDTAEQRLLDSKPANPDAGEHVRAIQVDGTSLVLDHLGPMVIQTDGTVQRITNWTELSEAEQATSLRVIAKRNKQRLEALKQQTQENTCGWFMCALIFPLA